MKRIGFWEKWNKEAGLKELSLTRLQMTIFTIFAMFFIYQYFITESNEPTVNAIFLVIVILLGAFAPKAIKDLAEFKDKVK